MKSKLNYKSYPNLTRQLLRGNREVLRVEVIGSCCWHIFSDIHFSGEKQYLSTGFNSHPLFDMKSAKRNDCNNELL